MHVKRIAGAFGGAPAEAAEPEPDAHVQAGRKARLQPSVFQPARSPRPHASDMK